MFHGSYKKDVRIDWERATQTVKVRWTDYEKVLKGAKGYSRYGSKQIKCGVKYTRAEATAELTAYAEREQQKSIERAEAIRKDTKAVTTSASLGKTHKVVAAAFLRLLENCRITSSERPQTINDCRNDVNRFADWLDKHHPNIELHRITKVIAEDYCKHLSKSYSYSSVKTYKAHLVYTFNSIIDIFEESPVKYSNPFARVKLSNAVNNTVEGRKDIYTLEQLTHILKRAGESKKYKQPACVQRFAFFYMLMVTGWRIGDVARLTWDAVDFKKRVITNLHSKTVKTTGVHTKVYMTKLMEEVFTALSEFDRPKEYKNFVFSVNREGVKNLQQRNVTNAQTHIDNMRKELGLHEVEKRGKNEMHAHTIHSIRGSFITHMGGKRFSETLVDYLAGHNLKGVNKQHYNRYDSDPEYYTRDIIEEVEKLVDARHAFHVAMYGENTANGLMCDGDGVSFLFDEGAKALMEPRYWTEDAVSELCNYAAFGHPTSTIKRVIIRLNKLRAEEGARKVDAAFVAKHLRRH